MSVWWKIVVKIYHTNMLYKWVMDRNIANWVFSMANNIWHEIMYDGVFLLGRGSQKVDFCVGGILFLGKKRYIF